MKIAVLPMGAIGTNCYVISDENGIAAIIDCDGDPTPLFGYITENNLTPTHILLTHGHFDHIGAVRIVQEKYDCKVYAGEKESRVLSSAEINHSLYSGTPLTIEPDAWVSDGEIIHVGMLEFKTMFTPGHTEGSVCFICNDCIFSGDTLFQGSCGRTDLATGDWATIMQSLKRLRDLPGDYHVYPGHGPHTTLEAERLSNPYM